MSKTKIKYVGALPDGHVEYKGAQFKFTRGETIEVPRELAVTLEAQSPADWKTTDAVEKAAEKEKA